jgi:nitrate reductase gamma subunit
VIAAFSWDWKDRARSEHMLYRWALYSSLAVFGVGLIYRLSLWFRQDVGMGEKGIPAHRRVSGASKAVGGVLFSGRILGLIRSFVLDVLFQLRILRDPKDKLLRVMHLLIFTGFTLLLLSHALGSIVMDSLFANYQPTLQPFLFLRNLFGILVLVGLGLALVRRALPGKERLRTTGMDSFVIGLLVVIVLSGFLLEASKISSYSAFQQMVHDYAMTDNREDLNALEAYWVERYGVISPHTNGDARKDILDKGREIHEASCATCHSEPQGAFVSYSLSLLMKPVARGMDSSGLPSLLWTVHFLVCFVGLAYVPFSKMFHIFATPVSLLIATVGGRSETPAHEALRQVIEVDGCRHGGTCRELCPVRARRDERIGRTSPFSPSREHVGGKTWKELGVRPFQG